MPKENSVIREEMMQVGPVTISINPPTKKEINKFYKVSFERFVKDYNTDSVTNIYNDIYNNIKLPKRATKYSAGYDFYSPISFTLEPGKSIKIPTGIKAQLKNNCVLLCVPRSSLGFKYKLKLDNTIGIIDADYFNSDNEGHIWLCMTNMNSDRVLKVEAGQAIAQGIIVNYDVTEDDYVNTERNGGIGSTDFDS